MTTRAEFIISTSQKIFIECAARNLSSQRRMTKDDEASIRTLAENALAASVLMAERLEQGRLLKT